jgi:polyisoprenoid-binding protein YceI
MRWNYILLAVLTFATTQTKAQSVTFTVDSTHSFIQFTVNRFGMVDVTGRFDSYAGSIEYDSSNIKNLKVNAVIQTASANSGYEKRDQAITSVFLLDAEHYPEIKFNSSQIDKTKQGLVMHGQLTIHGVTKEVCFPFHFKRPFKDPTGTTTVVLKATLIIDRRDYGISFDKRLEDDRPFIGTEIMINLDVLGTL